MELTYKKKHTYQILCNNEDKFECCYITTILEIYGDKKYLSSYTTQEEIPIEKMKKIIEELKE